MCRARGACATQTYHLFIFPLSGCVKIYCMRILIVEDNHRLNNSLKLSLVEDGYAVDSTFDGEEGEALAEMTPYDAIILDLMLPKKDGVAVCRDLRKQRVNTPILMLTARDTVEDRVLGLDSGADDYLVKPFALTELRARLRALLRRESADRSGTLSIADLVLDPASHQVQRAGKPIDLTAKEFALLSLLMQKTGQVLSRTQIASLVWDIHFDSDSNVVEVAMRRLRAKVDDPFADKLIHTVRGVGYVLESRAASST